MPLEVIEQADSYRLTTPAAVRAEAGSAADGMDDAAINALIDQASGLVAGYCNRVFAQEVVKESFYDGDGGALILKRIPVVSVSTINGAAYSDASFRLDKGAGLLHLGCGARYGGRWPEATEVVYTAGFVLPGDEGRNLPVLVERATVLVAAAILSGRQRDPLAKSESVEGIGRTDYWVPGQASGLNHPEAEALLRSFVLPVVA